VSVDGLFGEMAIDIAGIPGLTGCPAYAGAFVKSRASTSFTSEMKDVMSGVPVPVSGCLPDLGIKKTGPAQVTLGQDLPYSIVVTNTGSIPVPGATFTDDLPDNTS